MSIQIKRGQVEFPLEEGELGFNYNDNILKIGAIGGSDWDNSIPIDRDVGQAQQAAESAKDDAAKAEKAAQEATTQAQRAVYFADAASKYIINEKASGILAQVDCTAAAPLTECKIYGGLVSKTGDQTPETPATFTWVRPTELTVCGRNLVRNSSIFEGLVYPHDKSEDVDYIRYEAGNYYSALYDVNGSTIKGTSAQVVAHDWVWKFGLDSSGVVKNVREDLVDAVFKGHSFMIFKTVQFEKTQGLIIAKSDKPIPYEPFVGSKMPIKGDFTLKGINGVSDFADLLENKFHMVIGEMGLAGGFTDDGIHKFRYHVGNVMKPNTKALLCTHFENVVADGTDITFTSNFFDYASDINEYLASLAPGTCMLYFEQNTPDEYPINTGILKPLYALDGYTTVYADEGTVSIVAPISWQHQVDKIWTAIHELQSYHPQSTAVDAIPADIEAPSV